MKREEIPYECGGGWTKLIDRAVERLFEADPDIAIDQVKEKFGGLRLYFSASNWDDELLSHRLDKIVRDAEDEADNTCEQCGATPARLYSPRGWYVTRCEEHAPPQ